MENYIPDKKKMEEILPDYLFGNCSTEDKELFEVHIDLFPELKRELVDAQMVFAKVEEIDINAKMERESRNISVGVQDKLENNRGSEFRFIPRVVMPSLALFAVAYLLFFNSFSFFESSTEGSNDMFSGIDFDELNVDDLAGEIPGESLSNLVVNNYSFDYSYLSEVSQDYNYDLEYIGDEINLNYYEINSLIEYLDEEDFQEILKEMDNAKLSS